MRLSVATTYSIWAVVLTCLTFLLGYSGWLSDSNAKLRIALRERDLAIAALVGAKASSNHETDTVNVSSANAIHQEEASSATKAVLQRLHHITATPTGDIVPSGVADVLCPGQSRPRIAYCVVGAARTFASPQAYMSLKTNVIDAFGGDAHVFLRLKLRDAAPKKQRGYQVPSAHIGNAENLQPAIDMLRPVSVEIIRGESSTNETQNNLPNMQCLNTGFLGEPAHTERLLSQLAAWKHCSLQLQQYETRRGGNFRFDRVILLRPDLAWYGSVGPHCLYKSDRSYTMRWPMIGPKDPVSKREKLPTLAHIDEHSYCHRSSRPCFPDLAMILTRGHADLVLSALEFYAACRPGMKCCQQKIESIEGLLGSIFLATAEEASEWLPDRFTDFSDSRTEFPLLREAANLPAIVLRPTLQAPLTTRCLNWAAVDEFVGFRTAEMNRYGVSECTAIAYGPS